MDFVGDVRARLHLLALFQLIQRLNALLEVMVNQFVHQQDAIHEVLEGVNRPQTIFSVQQLLNEVFDFSLAER